MRADNDLSEQDTVETAPPDFALEARLQRTMWYLVLCAVFVGLFVSGWRAATGFALGGGLAYLNLRWLHKSLSVLLGSAAAAGEEAARPRLNASGYVLRYLLIATIVFIAVQLNLVSIVTTLLGLCAFAAAIVIEGFKQLFFAIVKREEH